MNETSTPSAQPAAPAEVAEWQGMTLDELRLRRTMALVKREVGRERMNHLVEGTRERVATNGVRGLLFNNNVVAGLKTADYLLLGWRTTRMLMKLWRKRR